MLFTAAAADATTTTAAVAPAGAMSERVKLAIDELLGSRVCIPGSRSADVSPATAAVDAVLCCAACHH